MRPVGARALLTPRPVAGTKRRNSQAALLYSSSPTTQFANPWSAA
jgi:hypothetical protein